MNVPGLVTVNVPLENDQLWAVEPFRINIFAVPEPNVTLDTVIFPFAVKLVVAASARPGTLKLRHSARKNLNIGYTGRLH